MKAQVSLVNANSSKNLDQDNNETLACYNNLYKQKGQKSHTGAHGWDCKFKLQNLIYFGEIQPDISVYKFASSTKKYFCGGEKFVKNTHTFTSLCSSILHSIANIDFALVNNLNQFLTPIFGKKSLRYRFKQNKKILRLISLSYQNAILSKMCSRLLNKYHQLPYKKHPSI